MKHRFFLFIIAAFMATSPAWAEPNLHWEIEHGDSYIRVDSIAAPTYIKNIHIDEGLLLHFEDTYKTAEILNREYTIDIYLRTGNTHIYKVNSPDKYPTKSHIYAYGEEINGDGGHFIQYTKLFTMHVNCDSTSGGEKKIGADFGSKIIELYNAGISNIRIAVEAESWPVGGGMRTHYEDELTVYSGHPYGLHLNNGADIHLSVRQLFSAPSNVKYGDQMIIKGLIYAADKCKYYIQESNDGGASWTTRKSGSLTAVQAREGATVSYQRVITGNHESVQFRTRVVSYEAPYGWIHSDTTAVHKVRIHYPFTMYDENGTLQSTGWREAGEEVVYMKPSDCRDYKYTSALPVKVEEKESYLSMTMPACPVWIDEYTPTYKVDFYDADATLLKTEEVSAGEDATPPAIGAQNAPAANRAPQAKKGTFTGWSKDYTNVHKPLKVFAKYDVYVGMDMDVVSHTCNRTEDWKFASWTMAKFEDNKTMAMAGDNITFRASVKTNTPVNVYFQSGQLNNNGELSWTTALKVGEITGYDMNKVMTFDRQVTAAVEYNNELPFQTERYYRFYAAGPGTGEIVYSEAMEIQLYYPLLVESDQTVQVLTNEGGFYCNSTRSIIPAKSGERIFILDRQGFKGAGLDFAFVRHPASIQDGTSDEGLHYVLGPGMTETVNVTTQKKVVWFDGVYGNGYPKQFDFSAQGMGKYNGYYAAVAKVGESVLPPADPEMDGYVFIGWKNETTTEYDDDAYLKIPAISDTYLEFTAQWEEIPAAPQYAVRFYGKDGSPLIETQSIEEGQNATPPTAPEVSGFHFTGWDKPYTTIKADVDITALYGEDTKTWTVTYKNWDGADLGTEQVTDGEAAQGVIATREGYTFVKWRDYTSGDDVDMTHITANVTVEAVFTETVYTVTYRVEGEVTYTVGAVHGMNASSIYYPLGTPAKASTEAKVYTFSGWTPEVATILEDVTFDALFAESARTYTVTFQNWDHTLLDEQQVAYGAAAAAPAEPAKEGYTFIGWDREFNNILADMTVTAVFEMTKNQGGTTAIENTPSPLRGETERGYKLLRNGHLYILRPDGKTYNAQGAQIQ